MLWNIPPLDTFQVLGEIYCVPKATLQERIDEMVSLLDRSAILRKPVRNLSLGERMKCELVASLLHQSKVFFLDDPTLGLDISIQNRLRNFILEYNRKYQATIPAQALSGQIGIDIVIISLILAGILLLGVSWLFRQGVNRYHSASS